ncbi:MAG TPA: HAD-IA family hydrolase [Fimbriimonadaceae bacterium]|nr:HAD-IA family hydrolase [Fimbriimonadaceae bacterium]
MPDRLSLASFDAVLFDIDGTLVDSLGMIVPGLGDAIERFAGVRPSDGEIQSIVGLPMRTQIERYLDYSPTDDQLDEMIDYTLARFEAYVDREKFFVPAIETLRLCKRAGLGTALVTSKDAKELAGFLKRFPSADSVDVTVCASDVQHPKPAPDSALLAVSRLNATRPILIGDSIYDLRCARDAGVATVAVGYGSATSAVLLAENPDLFIETPDHLLEWAQTTFSKPNATQEDSRRPFVDPQRDHSGRERAAS